MSVAEGEYRQLTAAQLGVWYAQQLGPDDPVYNMGEYLEIHGDLDVDLFEVALRHTISEAEAAHLRFSGDGETLRLYVDKSGDWPLHVIDVSSSDDPRAAAEDWMWMDMRHPVDPREGPLFTQALFRIAPRRFFWYQRGHHISVDGFSGSVIVARQAQVYTSLLAGSPLEEGALDSFSMLIDADSAYRASRDFGRDQRFWLNTLSDLPEVVSVSGQRLQRARHFAVRQMEDIDPFGAAELRQAARRLKTSFAGLMVTTAAAYLHRCTGADDLILGLPVLGRIGRRQRGIPGMTANVLPIRLAIGQKTTAGELAWQVSGAVRDALRHQRYRYEDMVRDLKLVDGGALFGLTVNVMSFDYSIRLGDCMAVAHSLAGGPVGDMRVSVYDRSADGTVQVALDTNPELYGWEPPEDVGRRFRNVLDWVMTASPADDVGRVPILAEAERRQVVSGWNDTAREIPPATLPGLFAAQVAGAPDAVAVTDEGTALTYRGLEEAANRLARHLITLGAAPESVVAVVMERSVLLITVLLAVVKTGAAYVPVDPGYPAGRVGFMLTDAAPVLVVTDAASAGAVPAGAVPAGAGVVVADDPATVAVLAGCGAGPVSDGERGGRCWRGAGRM